MVKVIYMKCIFQGGLLLHRVIAATVLAAVLCCSLQLSSTAFAEERSGRSVNQVERPELMKAEGADFPAKLLAGVAIFCYKGKAPGNLKKSELDKVIGYWNGTYKGSGAATKILSAVMGKVPNGKQIVAVMKLLKYTAKDCLKKFKKDILGTVKSALAVLKNDKLPDITGFANWWKDNISVGVKVPSLEDAKKIDSSQGEASVDKSKSDLESAAGNV